ncbi:hypothetical protein MTsPCn5_33110 [Croceitalea sp. MTPC5]|nr:hypothetical protein MTsPCn5_33110 [Croceitalea sp. MTPC5]
MTKLVWQAPELVDIEIRLYLTQSEIKDIS